MRIGYACKIEGIENMSLKSFTLKTMSDLKIEETIEHNLSVLKQMFLYNIDNNIKLFRISSDVIPLASHHQFKYDWKTKFKDKLRELGKIAKDNDLKLSMHPGQYTIINSVNENVIRKSIEDLKYHCDFLDALELDKSNKIVLHIGGVYNDKESAKKRFISTFKTLDNNIKSRLIIENDDKFFTIDDVFEISQQINIPVVFDNLHHQINHTVPFKDDFYWIKRCNQTWKSEDSVQKIHYSQQDLKKKKGAHSKTIDSKVFLEFITSILPNEVDVMLEVKDKNISAIKCINCLNKKIRFSSIENEWAKYKYIVLEKSQKNYLAIRDLMKQKDISVILEFYEIVDKAILSDSTNEAINAYHHVWGYLKEDASQNEKQKFFELLEELKLDNDINLKIKKLLFKLVKKYNKKYLIDSYFFIY